MIVVAFIPGTHGLYLEFVLNKLLYGTQIEMLSPLSPGGLGTSHAQRNNPNYINHRFFQCWGWPPNKDDHDYSKIIEITFDEKDLLTVIQLNFKRSEDHNIDPDTIHENTYFKLFDRFNPHDKNGIGHHKIIDCILQYSEIDSYNAIKAESWPDISMAEEFYKLPQNIIDEAVNVFGVKPFILNEKFPDCPKYILRDIFKSWFINRSYYRHLQDFLKTNPNKKQVYSINLRSLYNKDLFLNELKNIETFFDLKFDCSFLNFHDEFVARVPYQNSLSNCEKILESIDTGEDLPINLNVIEEAFINFQIEKKYNITVPFLQYDYFKTSEELRNYVHNNLDAT
jgi:hypothetical protein